MKITGRKSQPLGQTGALSPLTGPASQESNEAAEIPAAPADSVSLASSTEVRRLAQAAAALPSVRTEKVVELRGQIDEGSYYVESDKLARKVVDEAIHEILAGQGRAANG
jgi:negative regulator of flagellin synthesis FlgM